MAADLAGWVSSDETDFTAFPVVLSPGWSDGLTRSPGAGKRAAESGGGKGGAECAGGFYDGALCVGADDQ